MNFIRCLLAILLILHLVQRNIDTRFNCTDEYSEHISFLLFKGKNSYDKVHYKNAPEEFLRNPQFQQYEKTVIYIPGWGEDPADAPSVETIVSALLKIRNINIIALDYHEISKKDVMIYYLGAWWNSSFVGQCVGEMLRRYRTLILQHYNIDQQFEKLHIISHSMGSQVMAYAARVYGKGLLRLTALDAAWPLYTPPIPHLEKEDGRYVDSIHTDRGNYGYLYNTGHSNFYPNNGTRYQPWCQDSNNAYEFCSHHMSWKYYADSVLHPWSYPAKECLEESPCIVFGSINTCYCKVYGEQIAYMGYYVNISSFGTFYLKTRHEAPYGLGLKGLSCTVLNHVCKTQNKVTEPIGKNEKSNITHS